VNSFILSIGQKGIIVAYVDIETLHIKEQNSYCTHEQNRDNETFVPSSPQMS